MSRISLQPDEVSLYEGDVSIAKGTSFDKIFLTGSTQVVLTNIRIYFVTITKKIFAKEQVTVDAHDISEIKVYNGVPQVKQIKINSSEVILDLASCEVEMTFSSRSEAHKFVNTVYELVTGKSIAERGAEKFKGAVDMVNDTLGIDTVGTVKNVLENGITRTVFGGLGKKKSSNTHSLLGEAVGISKTLLNQNQAQPEQPKQLPDNSCDSQLETLKKMKDLLDAGILTQEEFDAKKKEILGL